MATRPSNWTLGMVFVPGLFLLVLFAPSLDLRVAIVILLAVAVSGGVLLAMVGPDLVPFNLDIERGVFWKGFTSPPESKIGKSKRSGRISDIAGLQIIAVGVPLGRQGKRFFSGTLLMSLTSFCTTVAT